MGAKTVVMPRELTAENGAKSAMIGEFSVGEFIKCGCCDQGNATDDGDDCDDCEFCEGQGGYYIEIPIDWNTIKAIYAKAVEHLGA